MDKAIKLSQLLFGFFGLLVVIITAWVNMSNRISVLEVQQQTDDEFKTEVRAYFKEISDGQTKILIEMQNKKNRDQ